MNMTPSQLQHHNPYAQSNEQMYEEFLSLQQKISLLPLRQPGRISAFGWDIEYVSGPAVLSNLQYQVIKRINDFFPAHDHPIILDLGANIGLSVLNYKRQFPNAHIIAFEPDPVFLPILHRNLDHNGASDVEVIEAAVWHSEGRSAWFSEGIDGSKLVEGTGQTDPGLSVRTVDLASYLNREIDLIKMDIEGAEFQVIPYLAGKLGKVKNLSIECHLMPDSFPLFSKVIDTLVGEGFKLAVNSYSTWRDLIRVSPILPNHFGQYLSLSAWRIDPPFPNLSWGIDPNADIGQVINFWSQNTLLKKVNNQYLSNQGLLQNLNSQYLQTQQANSVLSQQNAELMQTNSVLSQQNTELMQTNSFLSQQNAELMQTHNRDQRVILDLSQPLFRRVINKLKRFLQRNR